MNINEKQLQVIIKYASSLKEEDELFIGFDEDGDISIIFGGPTSAPVDIDGRILFVIDKDVDNGVVEFHVQKMNITYKEYNKLWRAGKSIPV